MSFYFLQTVIDIEYTVTNLKKAEQEPHTNHQNGLNWRRDTEDTNVNIDFRATHFMTPAINKKQEEMLGSYDLLMLSTLYEECSKK